MLVAMAWFERLGLEIGYDNIKRGRLLILIFVVS